MPYEDNSMGSGKKTLRARIPPPSKIPSSAVEMPPDDPSGNLNFLDVSFGAVDLSGDIPQLSDTSQEQNTLPPVKYDSVSQKVDSVLTQTEYSAITNQSAVQSQRPSQNNQSIQPSIKIGPPPGVPPPADYLTKQNVAAVNQYQNVNSGQPTSMYSSSVYSNNPQVCYSCYNCLIHVCVDFVYCFVGLLIYIFKSFMISLIIKLQIIIMLVTRMLNCVIINNFI